MKAELTGSRSYLFRTQRMSTKAIRNGAAMVSHWSQELEGFMRGMQNRKKNECLHQFSDAMDWVIYKKKKKFICHSSGS
jgi:hypothetical protein